MQKRGRMALGAALVSITAATAAQAEDTDSSALTLELGTRYWYSSGSTAWNHDASTVGAFGIPFGNPTSVLTYDGLTARTAELFFDLRHQSRWFVKGYAGLGGITSGMLDDEDYFTGQVKFSDTSSSVRGGSLHYASLDVGRSIYENQQRGVTVRAFLGYHYWSENVPAYGLTCNPYDVGGFFCGAPGSMPIPGSVSVITNNANWHSIRLGIGAEANLSERWSIAGEAAFIPYASLANFDSHHLRGDLGPVPNIRHTGRGIGFQLEAFVNYRVTPMWSVGLGARYWHLSTTSGETRFGPGFGTAFPLNDFTTERYGLVAQTSLRF